MPESGYLRHIRECNKWKPENFYDFRIEGKRAGRLKSPMWEALSEHRNIFKKNKQSIELKEKYTDFFERTQVLAQVTRELVEQGVISHRHGEQYPVTTSGRSSAYATIDRAAAPYFGLRAYGQHLNGFVQTDQGVKLWIARRSADRRNFPDMLDNLVAGGLPHELSLQQNLEKECWEEASIPCELARNAKPVGALTYCKETQVGLKPDTLYCYDLELPADFSPRNTDGEVAEFYLLPVEEVAEIIRDTDEFKLNCNLVIIDFLIRHGFITPEHADYLELTTGLHEKL